MRIWKRLLLRIELWWICRDQPWKLVLRLIKHTGHWLPYWCWCNKVAGIVIEIGPVQQFSQEQALDFARAQYRDLLAKHAGVAVQDLTPICAPEPNEHSPIRRLRHGESYSMQCCCGWQGSLQTPPGHLCDPADCPDCAQVQAEFDQHLQNTAKEAI